MTYPRAFRQQGLELGFGFLFSYFFKFFENVTEQRNEPRVRRRVSWEGVKDLNAVYLVHGESSIIINYLRDSRVNLGSNPGFAIYL